MFTDYHVHSYYSDDSEYPMEQIVQKAVSNGIEELCFTDHVDYGIKSDWTDQSETYLPEEKAKLPVMNVKYSAYHAEILQLQNQYQDRIKIKEGLEFGIQRHTIAQYQKLIASYPLDFVILSCHQVENKAFWNQNFQTGRTQREYNEKYYFEIQEVISKFKDYSVLGHLDLIKRYDKAGFYPFENVSEFVSDILKTAIHDGKGIEINTSSVRYGLPEWLPSKDILMLYKSLGGEIITFGSDAHNEKQLGAFIPQAMNELKEYGFRYFCTFDKMKPIFHKL